MREKLLCFGSCPAGFPALKVIVPYFLGKSNFVRHAGWRTQMPGEALMPQPKQKGDRKGAGYSPWRKFTRPAPGKRACRSPGGECEPTHLRRAHMPGEASAPRPKQQGRPAVALVALCLQVNLDAGFVLSNLDSARWYTSPLVKQGLASDRDLPGLQSHACKRAYVYQVS